MKQCKRLLKTGLFASITIVLFFTFIIPSNIVAKTYSSFRIAASASILLPLVELDNSSSSYALLNGLYNTSALITVQATISTVSNYSSVLMIISNYSSTLEIDLEVYSYVNITRILSATIRLKNGTDATFDQIIIENGQIIQDKPSAPYMLTPQETLYVDIINLQSNSTGITYIHTSLKIRIQSKSTFIFQTEKKNT